MATYTTTYAKASAKTNANAVQARGEYTQGKLKTPTLWKEAVMTRGCNVTRTNCTSEERSRAERVKLGLEMVYLSAVSIIYRKHYIAVKVAGPRVTDMYNLLMLEREYNKEGIKKERIDSEVIYRIERK